MDYRYCSRCKKMYTIGNNKLCAECIRDLDDCMRVIRDYLDENPRANINMVSEGTGVEERDILYLLRAERLELSEAGSGLVCDGCGNPISRGRYCDACKMNMGNSFASAAKDIRERKNPQLRDNANKYVNNRTSEESRKSDGKKMHVVEKYKE